MFLVVFADYRGLFAGNGVLFTDWRLLFAEIGVLFADYPILFAEIGVLFADCRILFADCWILFAEIPILICKTPGISKTAVVASPWLLQYKKHHASNACFKSAIKSS
ncbi:hypothetical protein P5G51_017600 [Virgibacillus sp. 179-BFC.A HS]|uniref:Uncharacterized protein n=1 Tax=Tigheibacillus jepli TaxID=3035914 RepID=A0ABU5CKM1_9BACI|nr:hypothetical protein [Virgibacillus sp. 179-BFC.A HS]MDY0406912.1 hypothetical protein [Virgibacillus sp. 179-BFC.A HS]